MTLYYVEGVPYYLDDEDTCHPYAGGDYQGHCGGCGACQLMQVHHYGGEAVAVHWVEPPPPPKWPRRPTLWDHLLWEDQTSQDASRGSLG